MKMPTVSYKQAARVLRKTAVKQAPCTSDSNWHQQYGVIYSFGCTSDTESHSVEGESRDGEKS